MSVKKKIFGSLFIVACIGLLVGGYLWWQGQSTGEEVPQDRPGNLFEIDLIDSPLDQLAVPETDLDVSTDFGTFRPEIPDFSGDYYVDIEAPEVDVSAFSGFMIPR